MEYREFLYRMRVQRGLSQRELAEEIGVSRQTVSNWEHGVSAPLSENLIGLSRVYGVTVEELLTGSVESSSGAEENETETILPKALQEEPEEMVRSNIPTARVGGIFIAFIIIGMLLIGHIRNAEATVGLLLILMGIALIFAILIYAVVKFIQYFINRKDERK